MTRQIATAGLILAAGKGTRMKSDLPKCLHAVCGLPMVEHVGRALRSIGVQKPILVVGHRADLLRDTLGEDNYDYAYQYEQLGTAHAVIMAREALANHSGPVLVTLGDVPLISGSALESMVDHHVLANAKVTIATVELDDPTGYGRIVRDAKGKAKKVVEQRDATAAEQTIHEINTGTYVFDCETLMRILPMLDNQNSQGEYYLTDVIERIDQEGGVVETIQFVDSSMFQGVNDRWQLAHVAHDMRMRILRAHCENGVTVVDPNTTYIGADVVIGEDTVIHPMTTVEGKTVIGEDCHIGPSSVVVESEIGSGCVVLMSHVNRASMKDGSRCGPYAHLRPRACLGERVKIGNFVEIKNAMLGESVAVGHLAYIGDATVGAGTNIGAGTITCNYDGLAKHQTTIGNSVFIGSNSTLVAPVTVGNDAYVAAGSTITDNVTEGSLGIGRARQVEKTGWASRRKNRANS